MEVMEELFGCILCTCVLSSGTIDTRRLHDNYSIICALYIISHICFKEICVKCGLKVELTCQVQHVCHCTRPAVSTA